jgi:ribonuclease VapC
VIIDSSAIVAMLRGEAEADALSAALVDADRAIVSAANYLEAAIVIDGERNPRVSANFDALFTQFAVEIAPVTPSQARIARQAYRDFGRGSGHPAKLNFGDCFAYALAMETGEPLLYKGDDFSHAGLARVVD